MITLALINFIIGLADSFIMNVLSDFIGPLTDIGSNIIAFQFPQTFLDFYSVVMYFVPVTTIGLLSVFTFLIIIFKLVVSLIHFFGLGIVFGE